MGSAGKAPAVAGLDIGSNLGHVHARYDERQVGALVAQVQVQVAAQLDRLHGNALAGNFSAGGFAQPVQAGPGGGQAHAIGTGRHRADNGPCERVPKAMLRDRRWWMTARSRRRGPLPLAIVAAAMTNPMNPGVPRRCQFTQNPASEIERDV